MIEKENNFVSVVVYLQKNETNTIGFLDVLYPLLENNFKKHEIICVTNTNNSNAVNLIREFKNNHLKNSISVIHLDDSQGLEECMNAGIDLAIGDFIFEFDSCYIDYDASVVMEVYRKSMEGFDIVSAIPPKKKSKISSRIFYRIFNRFSDMNTISTERFRIISRRAVNRVSGYNKIVPYRKAVYRSAGLATEIFEYKQIHNPSGTLHEDFRKNDVAVDALILFTDIAHKFSIASSFVTAIFMLSSIFYTICVYVGTHKPVEGWTSLMVLMSLGFFSIFIILTILIKYMCLMIRLTFRKQKYMVTSIEKL